MVNVAVIGWGGMGNSHLSRLGGIDGYEVKGIYDIDEDKRRLAKAQGIKAYSSAEEVAKDEQINAVVIATPNDSHNFYVKYFAAAGKHIICEKPVGLSLADYEDMQKGLNKSRIFTVHQNRRWDADFITVKKIIEDKTLGQIYRIDSCVSGANGIPGGWRKQIAQGGGMMLDWGVHLLDQLVLLLGSKLDSVYCNLSKCLGFDVDDGFDAVLRFAGGVQAHVRVDTNCYVHLPRWIIYGRDGTAIIEDWDLSGKIIRPKYDATAEIVGINAGNGFTRTMAYRPHSSVETLPLPKIQSDYDEFYKNFALAVDGKAKIAVTPESVGKIMKLMDICFKCARENKIMENIEL